MTAILWTSFYWAWVASEVVIAVATRTPDKRRQNTRSWVAADFVDCDRDFSDGL
jgi:hypothetical protein